jgi:hypothetical protein
MKICTKCGEEKELSEFGIHKQKKDGLYPSCKQCRNKKERVKYRLENIQQNRRSLKDEKRYGDGNANIYLNNGMSSKVDEEDYLKIVNSNIWCYSNGYAVSYGNLMHRVIMGIEDRNIYIDHINGDRLDNRKCNLRISNTITNQRHRVKIPCNNKSGYIGVYWNKNRNKWRASIFANFKHISLGSFESIEDAIEARKEAEEKYFGEFKPTIKENKK